MGERSFGVPLKVVQPTDFQRAEDDSMTAGFGFVRPHNVATTLRVVNRLKIKNFSVSFA